MSKNMRVLNMIVKDESNVIERCLNSMKDFVDAIVISDTGSTDNTIELILKWKEANNKKGVVVRHAWKNFAHNRNLALESCLKWLKGESKLTKDHESKLTKQRSVNYILFMDADDRMVIEKKAQFLQELNSMTKEKYMLTLKGDWITHSRIFAVKEPLEGEKCKWEDVVHEFLSRDGEIGQVNGAHIYERREGARSNDPMKYLRDALLLEEDLKERPDYPRGVFYLAQSYRDYGGPLFSKMAEKVYIRRSEMLNGWSEERYIALVEAGKCRMSRGKSDEKTLNLFSKAFNLQPNRLEAPYYMVRHYRSNKLHVIGYTFGKSLLHLKPSPSFLFNDNAIYNWKFMDEVAVCATWAKDKQLYGELCRKLIKSDLVPQGDRERIQKEYKQFG